MTSPPTWRGPLCGIVPPMVTPLSGPDELDAAGLERLVEHILAGGVKGLFVLGTAGEGPSLSHRLRDEVVGRTCRQVAGRVPVLVGITDTSFAESLATAAKAAEAGAAAVVLAPPYYLPAGQPDLIEYVEHVAAGVTLPLILYNIPSMTKVAFELDTLRQLAQVDAVVGIKDSSGDMERLREIVEIAKGRPGWTVLVGAEERLADAVLAGAHGGVTGSANVHPSLLVELFEAASRGDRERTAELRAELMGLRRIMRVAGHDTAWLKGLKCALSLVGICSDRTAEPFHRLSEAERTRVREILEEVGLIGSL